MILLNRVPFQYYVTKGSGGSQHEIHAGSYHMALHDAGISDYNIQTYSSILPPIAEEVNSDFIDIPFGSELYTIMSCIHGKKGEHISCGAIFGELRDDHNNKIGSLVCEVSGDYETDELLLKQLKVVIDDLHTKTYGQYTLSNLRTITNSLDVTDKFGTCLVAICFVSFKNYEHIN